MKHICECGNEHEIDDEPEATVEQMELNNCGTCGMDDHKSEQCTLH